MGLPVRFGARGPLLRPGHGDLGVAGRSGRGGSVPACLLPRRPGLRQLGGLVVVGDGRDGLVAHRTRLAHHEQFTQRRGSVLGDERVVRGREGLDLAGRRVVHRCGGGGPLARPLQVGCGLLGPLLDGRMLLVGALPAFEWPTVAGGEPIAARPVKRGDGALLRLLGSGDASPGLIDAAGQDLDVGRRAQAIEELQLRARRATPARHSSRRRSAAVSAGRRSSTARTRASNRSQRACSSATASGVAAARAAR